MNRKEIREYAKALVDEAGESPLNLQGRVEMDSLINISQVNVYLDLQGHIPWYFRKSFLISVEVNVRTYDIVADLGVTDFFLFENVYFNETGERADPLLHVRPDQVREFSMVGETGEPRVWSYEEKLVMAFDPTPSATIANLFKAFYFPELPDLNDDTIDDPATDKYATPSLPKPAHLLVALDAAMQFQITAGVDTGILERRYSRLLGRVLESLTARQGFRAMMAPDMKEYRRGFERYR